MRSRDVARAALAGVVVAAAFVLATGYLSAGTAAAPTGRPAFDAPPNENVTVVATDSNTWLGESSEGPRARAELVAFAPDGSVLYYDDSHTRYWDVDPVENTTHTVMYVAADHLDAEACSATTVCTRNVVERVNLTTGETSRLYARITPGKHSTRWHDVDRLDDHRLVVADIHRDRVYVVDTTTGLIEWSWDARADYATDSGGEYPDDWTHLNDVEVLADGRLMVSLRNQDQVVFLDRDTGLVENWTLGSDGDHDVLYEQHNPDYIPPENGGPAVVVGDSENDRVIEYRRVGGGEGTDGSEASSDATSDGEWEQSWVWSDARTQWPRDADRLPNGHTLVTDSNGNRVVEVNERGEVVWQVDVAFPYEAERLGTGPESTDGPAAAVAGLESRRGGGAADAGADAARAEVGILERAWTAVESLLPGRTANALMYVTPVWMGGPEVLALAALVAAVLSWGLAEAYWSAWSVSVNAPVSVSRRR